MSVALIGAACSKTQQDVESRSAPSILNNITDEAISNANAVRPGGLADDRTPISEGAIDPKSAQGAGQVLQHFAALIEQKQFGEASTLGEEDFTAAFDKKAEIHTEIGAPGPIEGAAGSLYVEIPVRFYGTLGSGKPFSQRATATLRRVNDVPGSTEQQRNWHIYRLDMQQPN